MTSSDSILITVAAVYVLAVVSITVILQRHGIVSKLACRRIIHSFAGLSVLIVPFLANKWPAAVLAMVMTVAVFLSNRDAFLRPLKGLYDSIAEESEERSGRLDGPIGYSISLLVLASMFALLDTGRDYVLVMSALIMIISDPLAAYAGRRFGGKIIPIQWTGSNRTLVGTSVFFLSAMVISAASILIFHAGPGIPSTRFTACISCASALVATIVELITPGKYDDLTVPLCTATVVYGITLVV